MARVSYPVYLDDYASQVQEDFYYDETNRHPAFVSGFGGGKTYVGLAKAIDLSVINRGLPMVLTEPTFPMIEKIMWPTLFDEMLDKWGIPYEFNKSNKTVKLPWGSEFWFKTCEMPRRIVGFTAAAGYADEVGLMSELAWKNLDARIRHPHSTVSQLFATFTPENPGWTHERWGRTEIYGEELPEGYALYQGTTKDNKFLPGYADKLAGEWDEEEAQARIHGRFKTARRGRVYWTYDEGVNVTHKAQYDPVLPLEISFDFNVTPGNHVEICQRHGPYLYVVSEIYSKGLMLEQACAEICERYAARQIAHVIVYGDATGRSTASLRSMYHIIVDILENGTGEVCGVDTGVNLDVPRANPSVANSCSAVRSALKDSMGMTWLYINPSCKRLRADLNGVMFASAFADAAGRSYGGQPNDIYKGDMNMTHASDCLRYWVQRVRPIKTEFERQLDYRIGKG